jgi:CRISPR-associated protein Cas5t
MLWIDIQAPFAACRPLSVGTFRPTAGFLTHAAAYGLVLNLAGVETRLPEHHPDHPGRVPASLARPLPAPLGAFRLALGLPPGAAPPRVQSLYQQLHNYPQMSGQGLPPELAKGRKNNIQPVRREILCDLRALAVIDGDPGLLDAIRRGLAGATGPARYGLPFLGDNNYLPDAIAEVAPTAARWYALVPAASDRPAPGASRLTVHIDRAGMAGTRSALFAVRDDPSATPPPEALVPVGAPDAFAAWLREHAGPAPNQEPPP